MLSAPESAPADIHAACEAIERQAFQDVFDAAPSELRRALGWQVTEVEGALVSIAAEAPSILFNRTLDLGTERPATREAVQDICRRYREAGIGRFFLNVGRDAKPPALRDWLAEEGLQPQRRWMKFVRGPEPAPLADTVFRIGAVGTSECAAFGRVVADAFDLGEAAAGLIPPLVGRRGWHLYGAFAGDTLVATGALFLRDGIAYLDFGATAPAYRRKGAQGALLAARLNAARDLGATTIFTMTGEAVPGDPQHSYHNIERAGFRPLHARENYAPA